MRTQEEIVEKTKSIKDDFWGWQTMDLLSYLDFEHAKEFLKDGVTKEEFSEPLEMSKEAILQCMEDYMEFAWEKANNCRGISAARSMDHYSIWVWLLGDEYVDKFGDLTDYEYYGKDNLVKICEEFGWDHSKWDDGIRTNSGEDSE